MAEAGALVADLGGTHARFGWVTAPGQAPTQVMRLQADGYGSPLEAAQAYLALLRERLGPALATPAQAAFAVAAPVAGQVVRFTNRHWQLPIEQTRRALGLSRLHLLNDFEALAYALPHLRPEQMRVHPRQPWPGLSGQADANMNTNANTNASSSSSQCLAVVGPGTGLGVAALVKRSGRWIALPGEGGHSILAANDDLQSQVLDLLRQTHGPVSAEALLSGSGLPLLHQARLQVQGLAQDHGARDAAALVRAALAGESGASASLQLFCAWLGSFCGDIALVYGARQGLYIGGGIVPRLGELFFASSFREHFEAKGRFAPYLKDIPTAVILDSEAALLGCAALLRADSA